jgi:hypothetical protein
MSKGQYVERIGNRIMAIQGNIAGVSEANQQLAEFRQLREWSTHVRRRFEKQKLTFDGLPRSPSRQRILGRQELAASFQALPSPFCDDYSWHLGSSVSASVPQVFSHVRTS